MTKKQHPMADMDGPMPYSGQGDIKTRAHKAAQKINARMAKAAVKDKDGKVTHYDTSYDRANKKVDDLLQKARKRKWYKIGEETQLNEISRKLRQRYERANLKDQNRLKNAPEGGVDQERKIARKLKNRKQGYQDAVDRDTGYKSGPNEETLDEIKNKTLKSYMDKVNPPILSHSSRDSRKDKNRAKGFAGAYARVYKNNLPRHKDGAYWNDKYRKEETFDEASPIGKAKKYFQRGMKTQKQSAREKADGKLNLAVGLYNVQHKSIREPEYNQYGKEGRKAQRDYMRYKKFAEETLDEKKVCVKWQDKPEKKRTKDYKDWEKFMSKEEAMNEESEHDRAYRYGWSARKTGHPHTNNPHERDSDLHKAWAKGWKSHGGKAFQPFKDAKGKTMGEEKDFDLPTQYGGEYSVRKINELSKDTIEKAVDKHYKKGRNSSLGIMGLNRLKGEYLHAPNKGENPDGTVSKNMKFKPYHGWKKTKDKKGYKSTIQAYKEETEQLDEAAKDRPFTKWAAKALYGEKGSSNLKKGACVTCGSTDTNFKDALSKKEWGISGMCQNCQDKVFSK